jgi:uncharacterized protein with NRDE domain
MCLIAFAIGASARWPLVVAANRDEFLNRPTQPLGRWQTDAGQDILSGRDLRASGTWMGLTPSGRVAFLTNVREANAIAAPHSRGELVTRWLEQSGDAGAFAAALTQDGAAYGGFNLVLGDFQDNSWTWLSNRPASGSALHVQALEPGVYGLSNAALNTPWPKTTALQSVLRASLETSPDPDTLELSLWNALSSRERAPRDCLPATGVPLAVEEALSSAFVNFPEYGYGTRSSTVVLASAQGLAGAARCWEVQMEERTHRPELPVTRAGAQSSRAVLSWQ